MLIVMLISGNWLVGLGAGLVSAFSPTGIAIGGIVLSDALFVSALCFGATLTCVCCLTGPHILDRHLFTGIFNSCTG